MSDPVVHSTGDKSYEIDSEDGVKSDLMEAALEDKAAHEEAELHDSGVDLDPGTTLLSLVTPEIMDSTHAIVALSGQDDYLTLNIQFEHQAAYQVFKDALDANAINGIHVLTGPETVGDKSFIDDLREVVNKHSMENGSGTPDHILAEYLARQLSVFDETIKARAMYNGNELDMFGREIFTKKENN